MARDPAAAVAGDPGVRRHSPELLCPGPQRLQAAPVLSGDGTGPPRITAAPGQARHGKMLLGCPCVLRSYFREHRERQAV